MSDLERLVQRNDYRLDDVRAGHVAVVGLMPLLVERRLASNEGVKEFDPCFNVSGRLSREDSRVADARDHSDRPDTVGHGLEAIA